MVYLSNPRMDLPFKNDSIKGDDFYQFLLASFKNIVDNMESGGVAMYSMQIQKV